jgi:hypothetical protein
MSAKNWGKITYEYVPSKAMNLYANSFSKHDFNRFHDYVNKVKSGKAKINAGVLYPYDIIRNTNSPVAQEQWNALPNYIEGHNNVLIMADVSGSMMGRPMDTSVGLGIYFAERNEGEYHNKILAFSSDPHFITLNDDMTLCEKNNQMRWDCYCSTNLEGAFELVLGDAVNKHISPLDMPSAIVVISDMEIDRPRYKDLDFIGQLKARYALFGYKMPKLIMWNVEARNDTFLSQSEDVIHVSGQSTTIFKTLLKCLNGNTVDLIHDTLMVKRYDVVNTLI